MNTRLRYIATDKRLSAKFRRSRRVLHCNGDVAKNAKVMKNVRAPLTDRRRTHARENVASHTLTKPPSSPSDYQQKTAAPERDGQSITLS